MSFASQLLALTTNPLTLLVLLLPALFCAYHLRLLHIELNRDEIHLPLASRHEQLFDLGLRLSVILCAVGALLAVYRGLELFAATAPTQQVTALVQYGLMPLCLWLAGGAAAVGLGHSLKSAVVGTGLNELYLAAQFRPADDALLELRRIGEMLLKQRAQRNDPALAKPLRERPSSSPQSPLRAVALTGTSPQPDAG